MKILWAKRRTAFRLLAASLACAMVWIGLELLAALHWINWRVLFDQWAGMGVINHQYKIGFLTDRELEFRRPPNARWTGLAAGDIEAEWSVPPANPPALTFAYDQWGYRNPPSLVRAEVALLGDSFVEGWYLNESETAARILESELSRPVANLGVAGYGTMQEFVVLQQESPRLRPSVVVWFFFEGNDLTDDFRFQRTLQSIASNQAGSYLPGQPVIQTQSWPQRSWTGNILRLLRIWSHSQAARGAPYFGQLNVPGCGRQQIWFAPYGSIPWSDWYAHRWLQSQVTLQKGAQYCRESGIHLLLCYVPIKFRVYRPFMEFSPDSPCSKWALWDLPADFAAFCDAAQISYLDLTEPLRESVRAGGFPYPPNDSHWGAEGHRLVARLLRDEIRRRGWLPVGP